MHLLSRAILDDAGSVDDAVAIASAPTSASTSLTVVDDRDGAVSIELFPGGPGLLAPTDGVLVRTNHFVSDGGRDGCLASTISASTEVRRAHLVETFADRMPLTATDVVAAMTHHDDEGGVCRHPDTDTDPVLWHRTLATVAIDAAAAPSTYARTGRAGAG